MINDKDPYRPVPKKTKNIPAINWVFLEDHCGMYQYAAEIKEENSNRVKGVLLKTQQYGNESDTKIVWIPGITLAELAPIKEVLV